MIVARTHILIDRSRRFAPVYTVTLAVLPLRLGEPKKQSVITKLGA